MTFAIGQRVRIIVQGHAKSGEVVKIAGYRSFPECPDVPPWPCFAENGVLWPLCPDWIEPTNVRLRQRGEQMALFE
jgi:hypothetical protein